MTRLLPVVAFVAVTLVAGCRFDAPAPEAAGTPSPAVTATAPPVAIDPTVVVQPTPGVLELHVWGPVHLSPQADSEAAAVFETQRQAFETEVADILIAYEPKAETGSASLSEYLATASAVAPGVLPDVIIFHTGQLEALAESQLLAPLDPLLTPEFRTELYSFALRDTRLNGSWLAVPLSVQIQHGVRRRNESLDVPAELEEYTESSAPRWLFAGQGYEDGEMSTALLLQLIALGPGLPAPGASPDDESLSRLAGAFQEAASRGAVPRTVLTLGDESELYRRLQNRQADIIQSGSVAFLSELDAGRDVVFTALPTLGAVTVTVADGYAIAITAEDPQRQEAAALWLQWLFEPHRLAEWNRLTYGFPATREGVSQTIDDAPYQLFVNSLMDDAWLRPGDQAWRDYARSAQELFRALMQSQITPDEFARSLDGVE